MEKRREDFDATPRVFSSTGQATRSVASRAAAVP
jgi:hypothetical protein